MATGDQIKALLESHVAQDDDRFLATAMQVAAHAARRGQNRLAEELREMVTAAKRRRSDARQNRSPSRPRAGNCPTSCRSATLGLAYRTWSSEAMRWSA